MSSQRGRFKKITIPATAGNVGWEAAALGVYWRLLYGRLILVCDATVVTRNIQLYITEPVAGVVMTRLARSIDLVAGNTGAMSVGPVNFLGTTSTTGEGSYIGLGYPPLIANGFKFRVDVSAGVAGDVLTGYLIVEESSP